MKVDGAKNTIKAVDAFISDLREIVRDAEDSSADMARVATMYDLRLQSIKNIESADLVVAVNPEAATSVVQRRSDSNQTHPFSYKDLLEKINKSRKGRKITTHDLSGDALAFLRNLTDENYNIARFEWKESQRQKELKKTK